MQRLVHLAAIMTLALSGCASSNVAACWDEAAKVYGVDPWLLYGIAKVEAGADNTTDTASAIHPRYGAR